MQLGMVGLGRMGANMVRRLMAGGHECVAYDVDGDAVDAIAGEGALPAKTLHELVESLDPPRHVWVMIPARFVGDTVDALVPLLSPGDTVVDGGNSWYRHAVDRSEQLSGHDIHYVDVGTSGGVHGLERGYCLMVGGGTEPVGELEPIFDTLAPGVTAADRTPGRTGDPTPAERGWLHCGPPGAGHFVKMVHNGIEYGMMAAYAEGINLLRRSDIGRVSNTLDSEIAALDDPRYYQYDMDLAAITEVWRRGSVVTSWLLDLTAEALLDDPQLDRYEGHVGDSGEGRWTILAAVDEGVPAPVLSAALYSRFESRQRADMANKVLSAMRAGFGGHREQRDPAR